MRTKNTKLKDVWQTPPVIINMLTSGGATIDTDPCAGEGTEIGDEYNYRQGGLEKPWFGTVFVNPPFSEKKDWLERAITQEATTDDVKTVYVVTPDSTDTKSWWHAYIAEYANYIWFSHGRINYISPPGFEPKPEEFAETDNVTFGTAISVFGELPSTVRKAMIEQGQLVESVRV